MRARHRFTRLWCHRSTVSGRTRSQRRRSTWHGTPRGCRLLPPRGRAHGRADRREPLGVLGRRRPAHLDLHAAEPGRSFAPRRQFVSGLTLGPTRGERLWSIPRNSPLPVPADDRLGECHPRTELERYGLRGDLVRASIPLWPRSKRESPEQTSWVARVRPDDWSSGISPGGDRLGLADSGRASLRGSGASSFTASTTVPAGSSGVLNAVSFGTQWDHGLRPRVGVPPDGRPVRGSPPRGAERSAGRLRPGWRGR